MKSWDCRRFHKLIGRDSLSKRDREFMSRHRVGCEPCVREEEAEFSASLALKSAVLEPVLTPDWTTDTARKSFLAFKRESVLYWRPVLVGACVASMLLLAAIQVASRSAELPVFRPTREDARLMRGRRAAEPLLLLKRLPASTDESVDSH